MMQAGVLPTVARLGKDVGPSARSLWGSGARAARDLHDDLDVALKGTVPARKASAPVEAAIYGVPSG